MLVNPLFPKDDEDEKPSGAQRQGHVFHNHKGKTIQPVSNDLHAASPHVRAINPRHHYPEATMGMGKPKTHEEAAVELIRRKVAAVFEEEPDAEEELQVAAQPVAHPSKHQQFMNKLSGSGKSLAHIQTEWHAYYASLSDVEKHEVWQEFYRNNNQPGDSGLQSGHARPKMPGLAEPQTATVEGSRQKHAAVVRDHLPNRSYAAKHGQITERRSRKQIKQQILDKVNLSANAQAKAKQHFQSLTFGIGTGLLVLLIFLFGFFNEMFIAPFIQPSRHVSATPIILNTDSVAASDTPEVIIPKINVQIPVVYDEKSVNEADVQNALERGIIHYPTTVAPGQQGNASFFGHSSNNLFNKGKYKFAFVLLHQLAPGDIFYLTYGKKVYSYRVFDKRIVPPTELSVLGAVPGKLATATLITCDPPGTSTNRLVVWGEQITPDPAGAPVPATPAVDQSSTPTELPSEGPTMWNRFWGWLF